jgi:PAS domain-containing protein
MPKVDRGGAAERPTQWLNPLDRIATATNACAVSPKAVLRSTIVTVDIKELMFSEEALKDSETRYRRLFETAQDGILILDAKTGAITDVNPFLVELLGYSRAEFF